LKGDRYEKRIEKRTLRVEAPATAET